MEIVYKVGDFPDPGDRDVNKGIQEMNKNNYRKALKHFEKGSIYDNEYALLFSAIFHVTGFGLEKREPRKAMDLFKRVASDWKNFIAQYLIGLMYFEGDEGVPQNKTTGVRWILLAAENGWPDAIAIMRNIDHLDGKHIKEDHKNAIDWYDKVIKNIDSTYGIFYLFGNKNFEVDFTHVSYETMKFAQIALKEGSVSPIKNIRGTYEDKVPHFNDYQRILIWRLLTKRNSNDMWAYQCEHCLIHLRTELIKLK